MHHNCRLAGLALTILASMGAAHSHDIFENQRPSFDCLGDLNRAEQLICDNREDDHLAALDRMLETVYETKVDEITDNPAPSVDDLNNETNSIFIPHPYETVDELIVEQRQWLEYRNTLYDYESIQEAYERRISRLASSTVILDTSQFDKNMVYTTEAEDGSCTGWLPEPDEVEGRCKELAMLSRGFDMMVADGYVVITIGYMSPKYRTCNATYFGPLSEFNEHYSIEFGVNGVVLSHRYANTDPCDYWGGMGTTGLGSWGEPKQHE